MRKGGSTSRFPRRRAGRWSGSRRNGSGFSGIPVLTTGKRHGGCPCAWSPERRRARNWPHWKRPLPVSCPSAPWTPKLFGRRQTTSDVQERFVSCLKTSTRGNPFIKVKVLLDRVCLWDAEQRPLEVRDLSNRMCKLRAELKQVWMMSGQCGLLIEVTDLMLRDEEPQRCPF